MVGMKPYSEDLRTSIVAAVEDGMTKSQAARLFGVSLSSVKRYCTLAANEKPLAPRNGGGAEAPEDEQRHREVTPRGREQAPLRRCSGAGRLPACRERGGAFGFHRKEAIAQARVLPKKRSLLGASERDEFLRAAWRVEISERL
jgi:transposase